MLKKLATSKMIGFLKGAKSICDKCEKKVLVSWGSGHEFLVTGTDSQGLKSRTNTNANANSLSNIINTHHPQSNKTPLTKK
jgi:hypothetical protein